MIEYLLVILEKGAVPFCHYDNPFFHSLAEPEFMPLDILDAVIGQAQERGLFLNFLLGKRPLPTEYEDRIGRIAHARMVPAERRGTYPDAVVVLEADDRESLAALEDDPARNLILRLGPADLPNLSEVVASLRGKFKRLNLHLVGLEAFSSKQLDRYRAELNKLAEFLFDRYRAREEIEINVLTDRMMLRQMNNCDAGVRHLTVAPNGMAYVCPAFYYAHEADALGPWRDGVECPGENRRLLDLGHAPLCSRCDAYHCKRCVYLNRKTTLELNVPSRQQCLTAHAEREVSRRLLQSLKGRKPFDQFPPIPGLDYEDPLEVIVRENWRPELEPETGPVRLDADDRLAEIYEMQKKILRKLGAD